MVDKMEKMFISASAIKSTQRQQIEANRIGLGALRLLAEEKTGLVQTGMATFMNASGVVQSNEETGRIMEPHQTETITNPDRVLGDTPDSHDEYSIGQTRIG
jgi:hypothetical protein